jgi:hypothetical protein
MTAVVKVGSEIHCQQMHDEIGELKLEEVVSNRRFKGIEKSLSDFFSMLMDVQKVQSDYNLDLVRAIKDVAYELKLVNKSIRDVMPIIQNKYPIVSYNTDVTKD